MGREAEIMKKKVCIIVFFGSWETRKPNLSYKIKLVTKSLKPGIWVQQYHEEMG